MTTQFPGLRLAATDPKRTLVKGKKTPANFTNGHDAQSSQNHVYGYVVTANQGP